MFDWNKLALLRTLANEDSNSRSLRCSAHYKRSWLRKYYTVNRNLPGPGDNLLKDLTIRGWEKNRPYLVIYSDLIFFRRLLLITAVSWL